MKVRLATFDPGSSVRQCERLGGGGEAQRRGRVDAADAQQAHMDSVLDAIAVIVGRAAESWLGIVALTSPIWLLAAVRIRQTLQRRRAFREFAAAHHLRFVGTIPSDARAPYTRIKRVSREVLLSNVIEGQWDGLPIHLFDRARCAAVRGRSAPSPRTRRR
jgi:hypothetical protein